ncbi:hypothetical protein [Paraburkholderia sp. DHOC27]|uniref:hypothetical protein n=1 Tax=Paraburkholderia sp. DHOC27 TaxID=2303330 RepID=UPI000E3BDB35|nr:hypothetical protein [Paraburkholderia sp. DHOC27]RFU45268.1 hypothetical protein D0B32_21785 [Paraburkholderia sp. DHOC27]
MKSPTRLITLSAALMLGMLSPLAHADFSEGAHQFKSDVKSAGKQTGHAIRDAGHAVAHGAKTAGHAVADTTRNGYYKTKHWVKEKT